VVALVEIAGDGPRAGRGGGRQFYLKTGQWFTALCPTSQTRDGRINVFRPIGRTREVVAS
jgi:hypothetical protein